MAKVTFDENGCKQCSLCVAACPKKIIEIAKDRINLGGYSPAQCSDMDACIGCAACARMCPDSVITVER